jgi:hypothetical protein
MPSFGDYAGYQNHYSNKSTDLAVLAATDDTTLITAKSANHRIYVQKIVVNITTYSAKTWLFKDSAGTPVDKALISIPAAAVALPSESGSMVIDFGPKGTPLTLGKNLLLDVSAAGAAGTIHVEAYEKLEGVIAYDSGASLQ